MFRKVEILKPFGSTSFVVGIGLAALAYMLGPTIKRNARGMAVKGMQGALMAGEAASQAKGRFSEMVQDMMVGSQHGKEVVQESTHGFKQLVEELKLERDQQNHVLQELVSTIKGIQEEISVLKSASSES